MLASLALGANKGLLKLVDGNTDNNMNNNGGIHDVLIYRTSNTSMACVPQRYFYKSMNEILLAAQVLYVVLLTLFHPAAPRKRVYP